MITSADLDNREPPVLAGQLGAVYFDAADEIAGNPTRERVTLHVYNLIAEQGGHILFSARKPPGRWQIALADLRSRLNALPAVTIAPPDDAVLGAVLLKLFTDRQLQVGVEVIQFAVTRMERSFEAAERLVTALDKAALASQRRVTIPLLREVLPRIGGADQRDEP